MLGSLSRTVVRAGSKGLNHPKVMRNYPVGFVPSVKQWFKPVRSAMSNCHVCLVPSVELWIKQV